jgi:thiol:disulfide interchange protein DsbD
MIARATAIANEVLKTVRTTGVMDLLFIGLWVVFAPTVACAADSILNPDDAFKMEARKVRPGLIEVTFKVAGGYALYGDRIKLTAEGGSLKIVNTKLPKLTKVGAGVISNDHQRYRGESTVALKFSGDTEDAVIVADVQGCSDAGFCFLPISRRLLIQ